MTIEAALEQREQVDLQMTAADWARYREIIAKSAAGKPIGDKTIDELLELCSRLGLDPKRHPRLHAAVISEYAATEKRITEAAPTIEEADALDAEIEDLVSQVNALRRRIGELEVKRNEKRQLGEAADAAARLELAKIEARWPELLGLTERQIPRDLRARNGAAPAKIHNVAIEVGLEDESVLYTGAPDDSVIQLEPMQPRRRVY
ncbi:MAG: hypothetical protein ACF8PN_06795 [Phycisphaerales bacterium]